MKSIVLILAIVMGFGSMAYADVPGSDWMTKEQVTTKLKGLGYSSVLKLEADDGHWEGDAVKDGTTYEIHVDPHSGALTKNQIKN